MKQKILLLILAMLCTVMQGAWAVDGIYCTASDKNRVVCTDGTIYDIVAAATADGRTAVAKIFVVDEVNKKGLALTLQDEEGGYTWQEAIDVCNNKNTSLPVFGATWKLPSVDEWRSIINASGSSRAFCDGFSSVGGTDINIA